MTDPETFPLEESSTLASENDLNLQASNLMTAAERRKKFGQVFTPPTVAALMADWVMAPRPNRVLDPAFGRGALAAACLNLGRPEGLFGYEIDPIVLQDIPGQVKDAATIKLEDFLSAPTSDLFDGIIANPPYIRHRELEGNLNQRSELSRASGCKIPKSANLYVDFLVKATLHLEQGGRAAFLIPAEWMSANFSSGLKKYLLDNNLIHSLVTFSNCSNIFGDAITTASLVLLQNSADKVEEISSYYLKSIDATSVPKSLADLESVCQIRMVSSAVLREASKWEPILRGDPSTLPDGWVTLGELASTRRGIATGANSFFQISENCRANAQIDPAHVLPCIGQSKDVRGLVFTQENFDNLSQGKAKIWLINFTPTLSAPEQAYVKEGEEQKFHKRFITKSRKLWFTMEKREPAPIWAGVFGRGDLRFIYNEAGVRSLTNFHCIYPKYEGRQFSKALVAALNSRAVRDLMVSHQRGFGGGLMKFEPKDLLNIPIPDLRALSDQTIDELANQLPLMHASTTMDNPHPERVAEIISAAADAAPEDNFSLMG
jgi:adenine-specific DNA-methyltransferase